jgi:hypothetical protein
MAAKTPVAEMIRVIVEHMTYISGNTDAFMTICGKGVLVKRGFGSKSSTLGVGKQFWEERGRLWVWSTTL